MRFLVDECTGPAVAAWLRGQDHDVFSVHDDAPGMDDEAIVAQAFAEHRILITNDKDFGEKVYREGHAHRGVIFMRLVNERSTNKIAVLRRFLEQYGHRIEDAFVVVTETRVRFAQR